MVNGMNMESESEFCGKKALVVGGSGGIGSELSRMLAKNGADVTIHGSAMSEKFTALVSSISQESGKTPQMLVQNLSEARFSELESSPLHEEAKNCDILCVCFGPFVQKPLHETSLADWQTVSLLDYALPGFLISSALPAMIKKQFGRIILFGGTGTAHRTEFSTNAAYAGAKSGLNILVASVAAQYAKYGISCNAILPGFTETEYLSPCATSELSKKMPLGKIISAKEVAEAALFLLKNATTNGATLRIDGGWSPCVNADNVI